MSKPSPIIFLLGTSTAGKSTICAEILRQDKDLENLGFET
jgi:guanylate kinase